MTTTRHELEESRSLAGLTALYSDSAELVTSAEVERGLSALHARVDSSRTRQTGHGRWALAVAAVATCALVALLFSSVARRYLSVPERPMLTYQIDGGRVLEGGYLRETGHAGVNLSFNEGSKFAFTPGTRGRIREVTKEGARIAIEHGAATFDVTPGSNRKWLVDVGPFLITVKGTRFTVSWDPLGEQFELKMLHGRVVVNGPVSAGEIAVVAGQNLAVNLAQARTVITEEPPEQLGGDAGGTSAQESADTPVPDPAIATRESTAYSPQHAINGATATKARVERRWSDELARGQWDRILEDVRRSGVETILGEAPLDDLFAVADAARYRRQPDLARSALLAVRRRFPNSPRALDAIFLLGRLDESRANGEAQAIARYDEYLSNAPNGAFAGEALGRKMTLTVALAGPARARPIAEEYLRRFPKGSYAGSARTLMQLP